MNDDSDFHHLRRLLELQKAAIGKARLCTNDIVEVSLARFMVFVNTAPLKQLKNHDVIVLEILAEEALRRPGLPILATEIVRRIEAGTRLRQFSWMFPTQGAVHQAVYRLREALRFDGMNEALIETIGSRGYRLSTPAINILLLDGVGMTNDE